MKTRKISIIGPTYPYRGGIAQYTEALTDALQKKTNVYPVSFKNLYPKLLYPGKSDKVAALDQSKRENVDYILDALSPISWDSAVKKVEESRSDTVIIMWWTFFWQPALGYVAWHLKKKGIKVIYFCHNVTDHEENWLKRLISKKLIGVANGYIVHSHEESARLQDIKPNANILRRVHPIYTHFPKASKKLKKRGRLEILYFGLIRPYKGVDVLISAMQKLNDTGIHLTIAGEVWGKSNEEQLAKKIEKIKNVNIEYSFEYVDEKQAANYFERADVVVLPYLSATGSGVITLAYHYRKPVIASAVGGLPDVVVDKKTGWLTPPNAPEKLAQTIKNIDRKKTVSMQPAIKKFCQENSWDNMATAIIDFTGK